MDTREKIIGFEAALAIARKHPVRWITGHFDPLLAAHVRRLSDLREPASLTIVVVTNPPVPLLDQRTRAELVAALAGVDQVVMKTGSLPSDEPEDFLITSTFIDHVLRRQSGEAG